MLRVHQAFLIAHNSVSGVAVMHLFNESPNQTGAASGFGQLINPPTGTQVKLQFYVNPYGQF